MEARKSVSQKVIAKNNREVNNGEEHYRKIINKAKSSKKGLVTVREGVELSDLVRVIVRRK